MEWAEAGQLLEGLGSAGMGTAAAGVSPPSPVSFSEEEWGSHDVSVAWNSGRNSVPFKNLISPQNFKISSVSLRCNKEHVVLSRAQLVGFTFFPPGFQYLLDQSTFSFTPRVHGKRGGQ